MKYKVFQDNWNIHSDAKEINKNTIN